MLTCLLCYSPSLCHSWRCVNDGEGEGITVEVPIQVHCGHIHKLHVVAHGLYRLYQCGTIVIGVLNRDTDGARDGFPRKVLQIRKKITFKLTILLTLDAVWIFQPMDWEDPDDVGPILSFIFRPNNIF